MATRPGILHKNSITQYYNATYLLLRNSFREYCASTAVFEDRAKLIELSSVQRLMLSVGSGIGCLFNPRRADLLSTFGETSGTNALSRIHKRMLKDPTGSRILKDRPRIRTNTVDLDTLRKLPENSFGRVYTTFLDHYHYSPDERHLVRFIDDDDLAYVMLRYREIHDLVHTLLEQPTDMLGEVVVKWVEGLQTGLPMCLTGGYFGALRLAPLQTENYINTHLDFAFNVGLSSRFLMCVYFEEHWKDDVGDLRASLNIPSIPKRLITKSNYGHKH